MVDAPQILSKSAYAARCGKSVSAVSKWIEREKLSGAALTSDGRINVAEADRQLGALIDPGRGNPTALFAARAPSLPFSPPETTAPVAEPAPNPLAAIRLRSEILKVEAQEREAAIRRGELILAAEAEREWAQALDDLMSAIEQFMLELPGKLGLDRDSAIRARDEWRAFRARQADQAAQHAEDFAHAA